MCTQFHSQANDRGLWSGNETVSTSVQIYKMASYATDICFVFGQLRESFSSFLLTAYMASPHHPYMEIYKLTLL